MAYRIAVVGQKGGVGKSSIIRGLSVTFAMNEWSTKIMDFDLDNSTCQEWNMTRLAAGIEPTIRVETFQNFGQALRAADREDMDVTLFDGPARANEGTVAMAKHVDLLILPTSTGLDDMKPQVRLANSLVDKHGVDPARIAFVLSKAGDSAKDVVEARTYLRATPYHLMSGTLYEKTLYRRAHDVGLSVVEVRHKGLREEADRVMQSILDRLDHLAKAAV